MNDLAQLECKQLGCVFLTTPDIIIAIHQTKQRLRDRHQATGTVQDRRRSGQQELWRPTLIGNLRRLCIDDIYFEDIRSGQLLSVPDK